RSSGPWATTISRLQFLDDDYSTTITRMSTTVEREVSGQKQAVALTSVVVAFALAMMKLVVGILTGSLGMIAEAMHSGLDLVAALLTLFAVRWGDRPADTSHLYGHGRIENLSAFVEAGLLIATAIWVIYEGSRRLIVASAEVEPSIWAFVVMLIS